MDYIYVSALRHHQGTEKFSCYDIACQWSLYLQDRLKAFPPHLQISLPDAKELRYAIGKLHWHSHKSEGHSRYSLNVIDGCGRINGEYSERDWWVMQPITGAAKLMGPGGHHSSLNDIFGYSNWRKIIGIRAYAIYISDSFDTYPNVWGSCASCKAIQGSAL